MTTRPKLLSLVVVLFLTLFTLSFSSIITISAYGAPPRGPEIGLDEHWGSKGRPEPEPPLSSDPVLGGKNYYPFPYRPLLPRPEVRCHWELKALKLTADHWDWNLLCKVINNSMRDYEEWEVVYLHPDSSLVIVRVRVCEPIRFESGEGITISPPIEEGGD